MNKLPLTDSAVETHLRPRRYRSFSPNELRLIGSEIDRALQDRPTSDQTERNAVQVLGGRRQASVQPESAACIKFLLLTGARSGDALKIEWDNVYLERRICRVPNKKGGGRTIYLSTPAIAILSGLPRTGPLVFGFSRSSLQRAFRAICNRAGIADARLHDMRPTYADFAFEADVSLDSRRRLLGYRAQISWKELSLGIPEYEYERRTAACAEKIGTRLAEILEGRADREPATA